MSRDAVEAQRARIRDQLPEQATAFGPVIDRGDPGVIQANRDELGQPAVFADHAQSTIARVHQRDCGLHDTTEHASSSRLLPTARTASSRPRTRSRVATTTCNRP
jgi:hypothetical protein